MLVDVVDACDKLLRELEVGCCQQNKGLDSREKRVIVPDQQRLATE
jgi:hypothetical protein